MSFTDRQIAALKPKAQRYEKMEPGRTGLGLRVTPRGVKTWAFRYRFDGEQRRMVLGTYPAMSLSRAHRALADARDRLARGIDPGLEVAQERAAERNAETMADLASEYIERHAKPNMKPTSAKEDTRILDRDVTPMLGQKKAKGITRRDLILLLDGIEDRGAPVMRNRVAGVLSRLFRFGMDRGIIDASPAFGIRRLDEGRGRERFLSPEEIYSLWNGLDGIDAKPQVKFAIGFALTTGQRRGEVAGARWDEIDASEALWRLPGSRTKNGLDNIVPLPPFIMDLIREAERLRVRPAPRSLNRKGRPSYDPTPSLFLFPARGAGKAMVPDALTHALRRSCEKLGIGDATIHDLRRTFATVHGEIGTSPEILAGLLNHAPTTITGRVYNHASNIEPKRAAMERWCRWLELVIAGDFDAAKAMQGAEVIPLEHATA